MTKIVVPVTRKSQGNDDPTSNWARARYRFVTQMMVMFGMGPDLTDFLDEDGSVPDMFNREKLRKINPNSIAWWDETHRDCVVADMGGKFQKQVLFPRDENGNYDENGTYDDGSRVLTFKYNSQIRISCGCAQIIQFGCLVGKRIPFFDYSGKRMRSRTEWLEMIKAEIKRVRTEGGKEWVYDPRPEGVIYLSDRTSEVDGVGEATQAALAAAGLKTVGDIVALKDATPLQIKAIVEKIPPTNNRRVIANVGLINLVAKCTSLECREGGPPQKKDWTKEDDPYKARYGDRWEEEIRKSKTFRGCCCVSDLVEHMMVTSAACFKDTDNEDDWYIYHDALSLMTEKGCIAWMKKQYIGGKSYYDRWILPQLKLNDGIGNFGGRPVGNCPEFMPWDACLNQDLHESVRRHCVLSRATLKRQNKKDDQRRFSMATPELGSRTYRRILDPQSGVAPSAKRIVQDIAGVFRAMEIVQKARGVYVEGLAERTGRRYQKTTTKINGHGGPRKKGDHSIAYLKKTTLLHPDLREMRKEERAARERRRIDLL